MQTSCRCGHAASKHDNVACYAKVPGVGLCPCKGYKVSGSHARRFPKGSAPNYLAFIRNQLCVVQLNSQTPTRCDGGIEAAHVKSKGAGGCDEGNTVPLCSAHHFEQHTIGIRSFGVKYGLNLVVLAERLWVSYEQLTGEPAL